MAFPSSLLDCFDCWASRLPKRGIVTGTIWSQEVLLKPWYKMFHLNFFVVYLISSTYALFRSFFLRLGLWYDWSRLCTVSFPNFYQTNSFLSFSPPRLWREPRTLTQHVAVLVVVLHQRLHANTYTGLLAFFGNQNKCGYSIACANLGFSKPILQGTLRDTSCIFFLFKSLL